MPQKNLRVKIDVELSFQRSELLKFENDEKCIVKINKIKYILKPIFSNEGDPSIKYRKISESRLIKVVFKLYDRNPDRTAQNIQDLFTKKRYLNYCGETISLNKIIALKHIWNTKQAMDEERPTQAMDEERPTQAMYEERPYPPRQPPRQTYGQMAKKAKNEERPPPPRQRDLPPFVLQKQQTRNPNKSMIERQGYPATPKQIRMAKCYSCELTVVSNKHLTDFYPTPNDITDCFRCVECTNRYMRELDAELKEERDRELAEGYEWIKVKISEQLPKPKESDDDPEDESTKDKKDGGHDFKLYLENECCCLYCEKKFSEWNEDHENCTRESEKEMSFEIPKNPFQKTSLIYDVYLNVMPEMMAQGGSITREYVRKIMKELGYKEKSGVNLEGKLFRYFKSKPTLFSIEQIGGRGKAKITFIPRGNNLIQIKSEMPKEKKRKKKAKRKLWKKRTIENPVNEEINPGQNEDDKNEPSNLSSSSSKLDIDNQIEELNNIRHSPNITIRKEGSD